MKARSEEPAETMHLPLLFLLVKEDGELMLPQLSGGELGGELMLPQLSGSEGPMMRLDRKEKKF